MIARNDGTKLSSLTNDSPASGGNERGRRIEEGSRGRRERGKPGWFHSQPPQARSVIDPIRMENDAEIRGFLINRQPLPFRVSDGSRIITSPDLNVALGSTIETVGESRLPSPSYPRRRHLFAFVNRDRLTITEIPRHIFIAGTEQIAPFSPRYGEKN